MFNDVKSLYEIIDTMSKTTYNSERLNITNIVSISTLSLKTYLANYYPNVINQKERLITNTIKSDLNSKLGELTINGKIGKLIYKT